MKVFIKYKTDGYKYDQKNLETDLMYAWNGYVFRQLNGIHEILVCMEQNKPILVFSEDVGDHIRDENIDNYIKFAINPSSIAMVFPDESVEPPEYEYPGRFGPDKVVRKKKELDKGFVKDTGEPG